MLCESLLELMERDSRITLGFGVSISSWIEWKWCSVLMRVASNFEFRRLLDISKAWCDAIGFLGEIRVNELKDKILHLKVGFLQAEEPILQRMNPSATVLLLQYYLHLPLVGT